MNLATPSPRIFSALLSGDIHGLLSATTDDLRPFLPSLSRIVLAPTAVEPVSIGGIGPKWVREGPGEERRKVIHTLIAGIGEVNAIRNYLKLNFQELRQDAIKEQQLLKKLGPEDRGQSQSILASSLQFGLAIEFERSNFLRRFRLFLSEILKVIGQLDGPGQFKLIQSDLFECEAHFEEICDIMCVAAAELPSLLPVVQLSEALLRLRNGPHLLARVLANMPDSFDQVVTSLVLSGETLDEVSLAGRCRTGAIHMLCHMHPAKSAYVQSLAVNNCKHPTLALLLALEAEENRMRLHCFGMESERNTSPILDPEWASGQAGVVTLLHNIIITGDEQTRTWFAHYLKCMQQKYRRHKCSAVTKLRSYILKKLRSFNTPSTPKCDPTEHLPPPGPLARVQMETESSSLVIESNQSHVIISEREESASIGEIESVASIAASSSSETLEELVDQMEIEISDHEGSEGVDDRRGEGSEEESEEKVTGSAGEVVDSTGTAQKEILSEKIDTSTQITTRQLGGSREGEVPSHVRIMEEEGGVSGAGGIGRRRKHSAAYEKMDFPVISPEMQLSNKEIIELMGLLQVCCALKTQTQMYLKEEEAAAILSHIVCTCPPFSPAGVRFIEVTLCVMLACPFLISIDGCEEAVLRWFQWLLEKLPDFDRACGGHCSYGELLLLISIHLREKQLEQIEELIANTLCMKVSSSLRSGHFTTLSKLFLRVFTEQVVCSHAVSVTPTSHLSADMKGYLPIHCIHQLIKMRNFRKYSISIKDWIYEQLLVVSEPLHPTLPPLLQEFVNSVLTSAITSPRSSSAYGSGSMAAATNKNHTPFSAEEVLSVFKRDPDTYQSHFPVPAQLLMFYYVLLYQDCYLTNLKALLMLSGGETPQSYSPKVLTQIPMRYLLDHAHRFQRKYSTLYPTLLKLTAIQFPQLCLVCEWLMEKRDISVTEHDQVIKVSSRKVTPESALKVLQQVHLSPSQAVLLLNHLSTLPPASLVPYSHCITSTLLLLLHSHSVSRVVQGLYVTLWTKLNTIIPRKLWLDTINALRPVEMQMMQAYTQQDIAKDPLIVLRCDPRALRCPPFFDLILRCLAAYTSASKTWLHEQAHIQNCVASAKPEVSGGHMTKQERDELCIALNATQESAVIQLLLEICLCTEEDKKLESSFGPQLTPLREIRCLICSYLHHTFIDEPSLAKLVHFQGYPTELIPMMVSGIPSMHICLDFIPELLAQPRTEKQIFGVQLAAHVIHQYPVPEAMGIAKDIFKRLTVLSAELPGGIRETYFLSVLPSITLLCKTFPPLCSDATEFLVHLTKICKPAGGGVGSSVFLTGSDKRFEGLAGEESGDVSMIKAIQSTFNEVIMFLTA